MTMTHHPDSEATCPAPDRVYTDAEYAFMEAVMNRCMERMYADLAVEQMETYLAARARAANPVMSKSVQRRLVHQLPKGK